MTWYWIAILCLVSGWAGYILKDQLTQEHVVNVTIKKPKIKKGGMMDFDTDVDVDQKRMTWRAWRAARKGGKKQD